ncbi:viral movement protein [Medicago truncatula]|uniref:Viral movement protein n=1 Tax=Medicago truncatula TaxID=3880 RepID=A0A072THJ7_MEDTR|nr:viral movement protein [Medicago truncatula]
MKYLYISPYMITLKAVQSHHLSLLMAAFYFVPAGNTIDDSEKEYSIVHFQNSNNYGIKKISTSEIYKQTLFSIFNFLKPYKITTIEENLSVEKYKDVYLLSRDDIRSHRSNYNFLHIGLVQFSIVNSYTISQETLNVSISLRDSKFQKFEDSVLVRLDSDLCKGDIKFNWFPNFSTRLSDLANSNALVVTIDAPDCQSLKVRYRVCYKLWKKSIKLGYLFENPMVEVDTEKTNVVIPKSNNNINNQS